VIAKAGDLAALLTNLEERDVLFIDEIHRLNPAVEEMLYPAMEDFQLDLIIGEGPAARSVKIDLPLHAGRRDHARRPAHQSAARPLRHSGAAEFLHRGEELELIVNRGARVLGIGMTPTAPTRSRAARAARRASPDGCCAACAISPPSRAPTSIDRAIADNALSALEVDAAGLDAMDRRYLTTIAMNYGGGPVGVETMAAALSEPRDAIEDIIEPFLIQCGFCSARRAGGC
jgi:Holliday junction DNA helicase RuvB